MAESISSRIPSIVYERYGSFSFVLVVKESYTAPSKMTQIFCMVNLE
jgi:hypothetical protein